MFHQKSNDTNETASPTSAETAPITSSTESVPNPNINDFELNEVVLANLENLEDTLAEAPYLSGCEDVPSALGSTGLPIFNISLDGAEPHEDIIVSEVLTPPISPICLRRFDSEDESPTTNISTPLKFDGWSWRPSEEPKRCRTPPSIIPTIDYLQVPPHHRESFRKRNKDALLQLGKTLDDELIIATSTAGIDIPKRKKGEDGKSEIETSSPLPKVEEENETIPYNTPATPLPDVKRESPVRAVVNAANCKIVVPQKQRKPSFSNLNIPCYRRRPSGQALDANFDYTFSVVSILVI